MAYECHVGEQEVWHMTGATECHVGEQVVIFERMNNDMILVNSNNE